MAQTRSRIKQMADEEADRVEAEHPDEDDRDEDADGDEATPDEAAAEPDVEPDAEPAELSMEARAEMMETALRLHHDNMAGLFGEDWQTMELCPLCDGIGAVSPQAMVLDPETQVCEHCRGWGQLVTEAVNESHRFKQCPRCMGNGHVPRIHAVPPPPIVDVPGFTNPPPSPTQGATPGVQIPPMPIYDVSANVWRDPQTGEALGSVAPNGGTQAAPLGVPV